MSIKTKIKSLLASEDVKINELAKLLTEKSKKEILPNTISKKINRASIRFSDVEEILDVLGYEIVFKKKNN
ncbi:MAG TPA: hypothetical protein IAD26_03525 [Candidatus Limenecus avicola]|jgi:Co-chaperone protein hscB|uniref:Phosphoribosylglycinamide formyltransferase n=1 Tax=Candidatus Limenecus avicola TaxID=2840847 RepID=A0A9D1MZ98_9CLOT|nr:putative uncharacterized protein [Clostridium sp. CAG:306]HIU92189.1 hypothetical protein [Candidatus Limenecus avicola]